MLTSAKVEANIPAGDLKRARAFYEDVLGFTPVIALDEGYVVYRTSSGTTFNVYETQHAGEAGHTIAQFHVDDLAGEVRDLKAKGVRFEVYEGMPGVTWDGEIAELPPMGRGAWFKDTEGNVLCIDQVSQELARQLAT